MLNDFNFNPQTKASFQPHLLPVSTLAKCIVIPELTVVDIDVIE